MLPHGNTATTHTLKPQIGMRGDIDLSQSVENEHLCMKLTTALGLPTARTDIGDFGGRRVLIFERFDWLWTGRRKTAAKPCRSHPLQNTRRRGSAAVLNLLKGSDDPKADRRNFTNPQMSAGLWGDIDGHAKSFSLFLRPGGRFHMTTLYDVMPSMRGKYAITK